TITSQGPIITNAGASSVVNSCGIAKVSVAFTCKKTHKTEIATAQLEVGCRGATAAQCRTACASAPNRGMCGTPCDMAGVTPTHDFDGGPHTCWRVQVSGIWYCYWDFTSPDGPGFINPDGSTNLCCPNLCTGLSFNQWIGSHPPPFNCTVAERCDATKF